MASAKKTDAKRVKAEDSQRDPEQDGLAEDVPLDAASAAPAKGSSRDVEAVDDPSDHSASPDEGRDAQGATPAGPTGPRKGARASAQPEAADTKLPPTSDKVWVFPYLVRIEALVALIVIALVTVWSLLVDAPLEQAANPTVTPNPAKAPWYFLGLQELLVYFDPWLAGVVFPALIIIGLMAIPYIDINPKGNGYYTFKERRFAILTFLFGFLVLWCALIVVGVFFRGPGWNFFWPWEPWDIHKVVAMDNIDLGEALGASSPMAQRLIGTVSVLGWYALAGVYYWRRRQSEFIRTLGVTKFAVTAFLFMTMMALPVKIFLRLAFNIKYVLTTPWFNI